MGIQEYGSTTQQELLHRLSKNIVLSNPNKTIIERMRAANIIAMNQTLALKQEALVLQIRLSLNNVDRSATILALGVYYMNLCHTENSTPYHCLATLVTDSVSSFFTRDVPKINIL